MRAGIQGRGREVSALETVMGREDSKVPPSDRQERTRCGEGNDPLPGQDLVTDAVRTGRRRTADPEEPVKTREPQLAAAVFRL